MSAAACLETWLIDAKPRGRDRADLLRDNARLSLEVGV